MVATEMGHLSSSSRGGLNAVIRALQPPPQQRKKKPKTIKIETEVEEIVTVNAVSSGQASGQQGAAENDVPIVTIQKKKKKLRRVDFDAEDDCELLGNSIYDINNKNSAANLPSSSVPTTTVNTAMRQMIGMIPIPPQVFEEVRPTTFRLTENGGYLHTKQSRMKISQANQGKSPWNKGKERTLTAKAKISAGVRARNDELLQKKLQLMNLTEEEWYQKKRQNKLLRERVRKTKILAKNYLEEQKQLRERQTRMEEEDREQQPSSDDEANFDYADYDEPGHSRADDDDQTTSEVHSRADHDEQPTSETIADSENSNLNRHPQMESQIEESQGNELQEVSVPQYHAENPYDHDEQPTSETIADIENCNLNRLQQMESQIEVSQTNELQEESVPQYHAENPYDPRTSVLFRHIPMFQRDIEWTPHPFDDGHRYDTSCPTNGPGGFICCQFCMVQYTKYMTGTIKDIQQHTTAKLGNEVEELCNYVRDTKHQLAQTMKMTRRKPTPIREQPLTTTNTKKLPNIDTFNSIGSKKKSKATKTPPGKDSSVTITTTRNNAAAKPVPDHSDPTVGEARIESFSNKFATAPLIITNANKGANIDGSNPLGSNKKSQQTTRSENSSMTASMTTNSNIAAEPMPDHIDATFDDTFIESYTNEIGTAPNILADGMTTFNEVYEI